MRQTLNLVALAAVLLVNFLANFIPLNGKTTGEIADQFEVFFMPADWAFAIWGVIYFGLVAYAIFQFIPTQRDDPYLAKIGDLFIISSIGNVAWIFLWHFEIFPLTLVAMLVNFASLLTIYLRLDIGRQEVSATHHWLVNVPFALYFGWITIATMLNVTILLEYFQWNGFGIEPEIWFVVLMVGGAILAGIANHLRGDVAFLLPIFWAYFAIAVNQQNGPQIVVLFSWITTGLIGVIVAINIIRGYLRGGG